MADDLSKRKLRMAQIGGGPGAFIGAVHRMGAQMDGQIELAAGAFSSDPAKSKRMAAELYLDPARVYGSWEEMLKAEAAKPEDERIDIVSIVTPNHMHFAPAKMALGFGFNVVMDKPMTITSAEARELKAVVNKSGKVFALTHTYTGYPMVKLARDLVKQGKIGKVRKIVAEYSQGWLYQAFERSGDNKQAEWRTDPARAGAGALGDIGTHAANLSETVTGLKIVELSADVSTFVSGRPIDDDANLLVHWEGGVKGVLHVSQIAVGEENEISLRVYGDAGAIEWKHAECETLLLRHPDKPVELWRRAWGYAGAASACAAANTRTPTNHPEGLIEAFANIYMNAARAIRELAAGKARDAVRFDFPTVDDGLRGMLFIEAALKSSKEGGKWTKVGG
ncbi:MAG: Gfo/Idh/MocA family oxidoreductase [Planctomycetota bacterium]|jgi:predicted dehydrogenase|nr:Gfo/Idh/MocA family oxidoreductase [Planctomycetota bacterium]